MPGGEALVTGAAGYVGSAVARRFLAEGIGVVALDDLSTGHAEAVPPRARWVRGSFDDPRALDEALGSGPGKVVGVVHCAALSLVAESVRHPERYRRANFEAPRDFVRALVERGVRRFLFSSSAAVYGEPASVPIDEDHPLRPTHPYGRSKADFEAFLAAEGEAGRLCRVSLRYFNAAGASFDGAHGEDHRPETHLIPRILSALREGREVICFGDDYDTPDGTCLRDFVHVEDLAEAHVAAWRRLEKGEGGVYNLGSERGFSVREVVAAAERATGRSARLRVGPRRPGDPARLVASCAKARSELDWRARYDLSAILESAWRWHDRCPGGY